MGVGSRGGETDEIALCYYTLSLRFLGAGRFGRGFFARLGGAEANTLARLIARRPQESEAHLVRRLLPEGDQLRWLVGIVRIGGAIVIHRLDVETHAGLDGNRLLEEIRLLPVVIPVLDGHERSRWAVRWGHGNLDLLADHVHVRHD